MIIILISILYTQLENLICNYYILTYLYTIYNGDSFNALINVSINVLNT